MNTESLIILDSSLQLSLVVFLTTFLLFSLYALYRLRVQRRQLADYFDEMSGETPAADKKEHFEVPPNRLKALLHSLLLALAVSVAAFLFLSFAPVPFVDNFSNTTSWQKTPLRLTQLKLDRFHEGFEIEGEVWNQTDEPIEGLTIAVNIRDHEQNPLERITADVQPSPLPAGRPGRFQLRYEENSPFLADYSLEFLSPDGILIPHLEGFNVR